MSYEDNGRLFLKVFLLDGSVNMNQWGIDNASIPKNITSVIGRPLVLYKNALGQFDHPSLEDHDLSHALAYQDQFRIGTYIDVQEHNGQWFGIAEITDEKARDAIRDQPDIPLYVSPTIRLTSQFQNEQSIRDWEFMHSALVDRPAFGVKKAFIGGSCHGDKDTCLLQLRKASIDANGGKVGCGFCTYDAIHQIQDNITLFEEGVTRGQRPDSDFAYVPDSAKGANGKKSDRKFPIYDCAHVRNAAARFNQAQLPGGAKGRVKGKICAAAKRCKIESEFCSNREGAVAVLFDENGNELPDELVFSSQQFSAVNPPSINVSTNTELNSDTASPKPEAVVQETKAETKPVEEKTAKELLDTIQSLTTRNKELELKIQTASADKESYETILKKLSTEVEELKAAREVEAKAARVNTISERVNRSTLFAGLPADEKQRQIENFVNGSQSIDQIKSMILPLEANFRKASLIGNNSYYDAKLPLGGKKAETVQTKSASLNTETTTNAGELPAWMRLPQAMFRESAVLDRGDVA